MKLIIVGGVAGGASAAARARRLSEDAQIILIERGPDVSFANCGLPYYVGGEFVERDKLLVVTPERLRMRFNLDVRTRTSVESIDRAAKKIRVHDLKSAREYEETYDKLILAAEKVGGWGARSSGNSAGLSPDDLLTVNLIATLVASWLGYGHFSFIAPRTLIGVPTEAVTEIVQRFLAAQLLGMNDGFPNLRFRHSRRASP
jgi:hypothetical protein